MNIEKFELRQMLGTAASLGSKATLVAVGLDKTEINKAEAYRRFSRRTVDGWIADGHIKLVKRGNKFFLNVTEMEVLAQTNDLYSKLNESA